MPDKPCEPHCFCLDSPEGHPMCHWCGEVQPITTPDYEIDF